MKKVLVLAAAVMLFAVPSFAAITGTAHDLQAYNTGGEICVYCHTPHGADTSVALAPLWNRTTAPAAGNVYVGLDVQANYDLTSVNATDAPLCLSCHDGSSFVQVLKNEPNGGATDLSTYVWGSAAATLTTDMSNDHPIGFVYSDVSSADSGTDTEIKALAAAKTAGVKFFGTAKNEMWCSSCHDVHDDTLSPFLNVTASGSALCISCHSK